MRKFNTKSQIANWRRRNNGKESFLCPSVSVLAASSQIRSLFYHYFFFFPLPNDTTWWAQATGIWGYDSCKTNSHTNIHLLHLEGSCWLVPSSLGGSGWLVLSFLWTTTEAYTTSSSGDELPEEREVVTDVLIRYMCSLSFFFWGVAHKPQSMHSHEGGMQDQQDVLEFWLVSHSVTQFCNVWTACFYMYVLLASSYLLFKEGM